jgi:hypothetical protein
MSKAALYKKIVAVMNDVGQLQKDGDIEDKNGKKMYSYLSEEQTTGSLQRAFITHGLVMFPINVESEIVVMESFAYDKKTITPLTKVIVTYKICDSETGESEEIQTIGYGSDSQDKGSNKAMTGAFKYAQRQTFMISTGDDGDHTPSAKLDEERQKRHTSSQGSNSRPTTQPDQTTNQPPTPPATDPVQSENVSSPQLGMIAKLKKEKQVSDDEYRRLLETKFNINSSKDLSKRQATAFIKYLQESA